MEDAGGVVFEKMETVLSPWLGRDAGKIDGGCPIYVLTNKSYHNGAVHLLNKKALESAADLVGADSFIILPSSIHERATCFAV